MHAGVLCAFVLDRSGSASTASLFCKEGNDQTSRMPGTVLYKFEHNVSCLQAVFPTNSQYACGFAVLMQAAYLSRLQPMPATAENMLKVTDRLLSAKPDLLPEYVAVAKSKGTDAIISA